MNPQQIYEGAYEEEGLKDILVAAFDLDKLEDVIKKLKPRYRDIIITRYGLNGDGSLTSLSDTAKIYNITKERVRQIEGILFNKIAYETSHYRQKEEEIADKFDEINRSLEDHTLSHEEKKVKVKEMPLNPGAFSGRIRKAIRRSNIQTLGDLANKTEKQILRYKNLSYVSLKEIKDYLHDFGLRLKNQ
ncbi:hypothetical protein GF336_03075 [Candidatus Woesearchaeota archaeon]|nr:hypothetical protein [Candidatus Woesearchaeota archaeon]